MEPKRYKENGEEVISPFIKCDIMDYSVTAVRKPTKNKTTDISFNPSKNFWFDITKDEDWNIDIRIHVNPKEITKGGIPRILKNIGKFEPPIVI